MFSCTSLTDTPLASHASCFCHRPEIQALTGGSARIFHDAASSPA